MTTRRTFVAGLVAASIMPVLAIEAVSTPAEIIIALRAAGLSWREAVSIVEPEKPVAALIAKALEGREAAGLLL